jgi:nucleoside triphosphatase
VVRAGLAEQLCARLQSELGGCNSLAPLMAEKEYPEPVVGAIVVDGKDRILLAKARKWEGQYALVGGHVELGETLLDAVKREVKEETNLDVYGFEFLGVQDCIFDKGFHKKKHFVFIDYACRAKEGEVRLNDEATDYLWVRPEEALLLPLNSFSRVAIISFIEAFPHSLNKA